MKSCRVRLVSSLRSASVLLFVLLLGKLVCSSQESEQKCPEEVFGVGNSSKKVAWRSKDYNNAIVLSNPPCLDEFGNLIARICMNRSWIPKTPPACVKTTEVDRRCPMNFEETEHSCIFVSEAKPWEDKCNVGKISDESQSQPLMNESVWLPLRRFIKYGPYESVTWGSDFGRPLFASKLVPVGDEEFFNKDCIVLNPQKAKLEPEYCTAIHKHICEFDKREANQNCPKGCVSAGINSANCFCKRKQHCSRLAQVKTIADKNILSDLAGREKCFVGGGPTSEFAPKGSKQALSHDRWWYTNEELRCSLCAMTPLRQTPGTVEMVLNFEESQRRLYLMIYSPDKLIGRGSPETIYCFTDASAYELKKRVEVRKISEQTDDIESLNVYEVSLEKLMGRYWCEVYDSYISLRSNEVVGYQQRRGHEYALRMIVSSICSVSTCLNHSPIRYEKFVPENVTELLDDNEVRVMEVFFFDFKMIDFLLHITTEDDDDIEKEFAFFERVFRNISSEVEVVYFKSSEFCLPVTTISKGKRVSWPLTRIGQSAIPREICLQENGMPIFRLCAGDFLYGAQWNEVIGECQDGKTPSENTLYLHSLLDQSLDRKTIENVSSVIRGEPDLPVLSIYYVTKILDNIFSSYRKGKFVDSSVDVLGATVDITDGLLNVEEKKLAEAQMALNITDDILDLVEDILKEQMLDSGVFLLHRGNVVVHICNPSLSNVSGIAVYDGPEGMRFESMKRNDTFDDVKYDEKFWMAVQVPDKILNDFNDGNISVITTIFFSDRFFVSNYSKKPIGPVISVTIPEYGCYLPGTLPILFKSAANSSPECGFWDYGKKTTRKRGRWSTTGGTHLENFENDSIFHICQFSHLTHFALLVLGKLDDNSSTVDHTLNVLVYLGDFLSMSGIFGIFITAIAFKKWRRKQGTIILLNLCVAIILEMNLTELARYKKIVGNCHLIGKFIHYVIISKFAWMLVYSFLQYMRFVQVFTVLPEKIVLISLVFGWGFALIPVCAVIASRPESYSMVADNFCYPSGLAMYLGLFAPIGAIILINTFVFIAVMRQVTAKTVESHTGNDNMQKLQMQLATLLFFVLGLPWLFLTFSNFIGIIWLKKTLVYIFSFMSNIDGLILFLFYVVFNGETRNFWLKVFTKKTSKTISSSTKISSFRS